MQQRQRYGFEFPHAQKSGKNGCNSFTVTRAVTMYTNASLVEKSTLKPRILGGVTKVNAARGGIKKTSAPLFPSFVFTSSNE